MFSKFKWGSIVNYSIPYDSESIAYSVLSLKYSPSPHKPKKGKRTLKSILDRLDGINVLKISRQTGKTPSNADASTNLNILAEKRVLRVNKVRC